MRACISTFAKAFLFSSFFCCVGAMYSVQAEDLPEAKGPFFYKADKGGKSLYLLGTMHGGDLDQLQCHTPIVSFLENSNFVFTELDRQIVQQAANEFFTDMSKSDDQEFNSLSENSKNFLVDILKSITQNSYSDEHYIEKLQQFSFWFIANFIHRSCPPPKAKAGPQKLSMDSMIEAIAYVQTIPRDFLDNTGSVKEISVMASTPFHNYLFTAEDINLIIDDYDRFCKSVTDSVLLQRQGVLKARNLYLANEVNENDLEDLFKLDYHRGIGFFYLFLDKPVPEDKSFKAFNDAFLKNRNQKWMEKIRQSHEDNHSVFIAVGLAHLIGSDNILDMLREDDFSIQRMNAECSFNSAF